jgi:hypothetical protein
MPIEEQPYFPMLFALVVAVLGTMVTITLSTAYLRFVRLERPAVGTFNGTDIVVVFGFIVFLPLLYVVMPLEPLLVVLGLIFTSVLSFGLRPLLGPANTWLAIGVLIGANIWMARTMLGTVTGWQLFWIENDIIIVVAAVTTANLYAQGGMHLRHVAWFSLVLAGYDAVFTFVWPITNALAQEFIGWPFDPSLGFRMGMYNATVGLGDLLIYGLFVTVVLKAYGTRAAQGAALIAIGFGAVVPAVLPFFTSIFVDSRTDIIVPAQAAFGPAAFIYYRWLHRTRGPERTMAGYVASLPGKAQTSVAAIAAAGVERR